MRMGLRVVIAALVLVGGLAYLVMSGLGTGATFYLTVDEVHAQAAELQGKRLKISGHVAEGSIVWQPEAFQLDFGLTDGGVAIPVTYKGVRPNNFEDGAPVIVEGEMQSDGTFRGDTLMMQCPSKYESEDWEKHPVDSYLKTGD